jgi:hypothetical protein
VCHVPDTCFCDDSISNVSPACAAGRVNPDRGFLCGWRGRGGGWLRHGTAWPWKRGGSLDSGPSGAARNRAALSGRAWATQAADADAAFPASGCDDGGRGGIALQGAGGSDRRNPGQSSGSELHRDKAAGPAGRGNGCPLLADPAGSDHRSKCGARPLADRHAAFGGQPGRPARTRRSALAGRAVPVTRQTTREMGGTS